MAGLHPNSAECPTSPRLLYAPWRKSRALGSLELRVAQAQGSTLLTCQSWQDTCMMLNFRCQLGWMQEHLGNWGYWECQQESGL